MADDKELYEPDIISVTDENGEEILFELLERYESDNGVYVAITEYKDETKKLLTATMKLLSLKLWMTAKKSILRKSKTKKNITRFPIFL